MIEISAHEDEQNWVRGWAARVGIELIFSEVFYVPCDLHGPGAVLERITVQFVHAEDEVRHGPALRRRMSEMHFYATVVRVLPQATHYSYVTMTVTKP